MENERLELLLENLIYSLSGTKNSYSRLRSDSIYSKRNAFFEAQHLQKIYFADILADELYATTNKSYKEVVREREPPGSLEAKFHQGTKTYCELDKEIMEMEVSLLDDYQRILMHPDLPNITAAILQSQAEDLNNGLQKLKMDFVIHCKEVLI